MKFNLKNCLYCSVLITAVSNVNAMESAKEIVSTEVMGAFIDAFVHGACNNLSQDDKRTVSAFLQAADSKDLKLVSQISDRFYSNFTGIATPQDQSTDLAHQYVKISTGRKCIVVKTTPAIAIPELIPIKDQPIKKINTT